MSTTIDKLNRGLSQLKNARDQKVLNTTGSTKKQTSVAGVWSGPKDDVLVSGIKYRSATVANLANISSPSEGELAYVTVGASGNPEIYGYINGSWVFISEAAPSSLTPLSKILFVDKGAGNNTTAVKGSIFNTWRDPWAALTQAVAGDTIYVLPGTYTAGDFGSGSDVENDGGTQWCNLWQDGINYYFHEGASLVQSAATNNREFWRNTLISLNTTEECNVYGKGTFTNNVTETSRVGVCNGAGAAKFVFEAKEVNAGVLWNLGQGQGGDVIFNIDRLFTRGSINAGIGVTANTINVDYNISFISHVDDDFTSPDISQPLFYIRPGNDSKINFNVPNIYLEGKGVMLLRTVGGIYNRVKINLNCSNLEHTDPLYGSAYATYTLDNTTTTQEFPDTTNVLASTVPTLFTVFGYTSSSSFLVTDCTANINVKNYHGHASISGGVSGTARTSLTTDKPISTVNASFENAIMKGNAPFFVDFDIGLGGNGLYMPDIRFNVYANVLCKEGPCLILSGNNSRTSDFITFSGRYETRAASTPVVRYINGDAEYTVNKEVSFDNAILLNDGLTAPIAPFTGGRTMSIIVSKLDVNSAAPVIPDVTLIGLLVPNPGLK